MRGGKNDVSFTCDAPEDARARARITVITSGRPVE